MYAQAGSMLGNPVTVSGLAIIMVAPVSMVIRKLVFYLVLGI
jgi:hypothetical protein